MSPPHLCLFSPAAMNDPLDRPPQPVSPSLFRSHERARSLWRVAAVAMGALAFFVPLPAGVALAGGGILAWRQSLQQTTQLQRLQLRAAHAAMIAYQRNQGSSGS
jgi:hypothetical protein